MDRFASGIVKNRKIITVVFLILTLLSALSVILIQNVNSDITTYLPSDSTTAKGQIFLSENFGIKGDVMVVVGGVESAESIAPFVQQVDALELVDSVNWIGAEAFATARENGFMTDEAYATVQEIFVRDDKYCLLITLTVASSTDESNVALAEIKDIFDNSGHEYAVSGSVDMAKNVMDGTVGEVGGYATVAIIIVMIILFLTMGSWVEPLVLLGTLGVSIIINMGTNFLLGEVSVITFSASAILQLGLAMDYAIFMLHAYHKEREAGLQCIDAVERAVKLSFVTIFASALTTVGGFIALCFMKFGIGADLAKVLIKGIVLSFVTVMVMEPCLIVFLDKIMEKTQHKYINLKFKRTTGLALKHNVLFVIVAVLLVVPSVYIQGTLNFNYMKFEAPRENVSECQLYADQMENQLVIAVPISADELDKQYALLAELQANENIDYVLGLCAMMDEQNASLALKAYKLMPDLPQLAMMSSYVNNGYTIYTIGSNITDIESEESIQFIQNVHDTVHKYYGDSYYLTGMAQSINDFADYTPKDFKTVSIISAAIIFVILLLALKKLKLSAMLVVLIQFGIWINLGLSALLKGEINFMSYIIISSIQMGATVDYAILLTTSYKRFIDEGQHPRNAAFNAVTTNAMSVLTSVSIMCAACLSVYFMASNVIVGEITMLIARGCAISAALVLLLLPCVFTFAGNITERIRAIRQN